jgi:hypothetical protein
MHSELLKQVSPFRRALGRRIERAVRSGHVARLPERPCCHHGGRGGRQPLRDPPGSGQSQYCQRRWKRSHPLYPGRREFLRRNVVAGCTSTFGERHDYPGNGTTDGPASGLPSLHPEIPTDRDQVAVSAIRLRKTDRKIEGLALSDVTGRITQTLLQLAEEQGSPTPDGVLVKDRPTHQDLANMSGTTRETVSRILKRLENQGYIVPKGKDLLIVGTDAQQADHGE